MCGFLSCAPTRDLALNPGLCPDLESNQQTLGSQASTHSTEPHQPRQLQFIDHILYARHLCSYHLTNEGTRINSILKNEKQFQKLHYISKSQKVGVKTNISKKDMGLSEEKPRQVMSQSQETSIINPNNLSLLLQQ